MSGSTSPSLSERAADLRSLVETVVAHARPGDAALPEALAALRRALADLEAAARPLQPAAAPLAQYRASIDAFNASQPNRPLLDAIRGYNHQVIDILHGIRSLKGAVVLDVGASPHGYALEQALDRGASRYVGIGLDIAEPTRVAGASGLGELARGDAEQLDFGDETFDLVVSMSTFEHILHVDRALAEMYRVLRPKGYVLLSFEPIWTASYGHHLHHFGPVSDLVPAWGHLIWTKAELRDVLVPRWPADAPLTVDAALAWVYDEDGLNRIGIRDILRTLRGSPLTVEWIHPLNDEPRSAEQLARATAATGLSRDELMTKGFSALLRRRA